MMLPISVVLIDGDDKSRNDAVTILKSFGNNVGLLGAAADLQQAAGIIQSSSPQIVILHVEDIETGVKETSSLVSRFPHTTVFATAADKNPDWILRLVRSGAGEYLTKPIVAQELAEAIKKVSQLEARRSGQNMGKGSVITLYNPSAGMGTTTIAVNLATTLAAQGKQVALIDLNLLSGDVATFLDLAPRYTLADVPAKQGQIDANFLRSIMVSHASGVHVLNGSEQLAEADAIQPSLLQEVIPVLQTLFAYTIIDTGGHLFGCNLATFGCSDHVLFTTVLNLPALKNAKRYLTAIHNEGFAASKFKVVVNRHLPKNDIRLVDAEKILNTKIYTSVPNAYAEAESSINKGEPLVSCFPRSPVAKAIDELARKLMPAGGKA